MCLVEIPRTVLYTELVHRNWLYHSLQCCNRQHRCQVFQNLCCATRATQPLPLYKLLGAARGHCTGMTTIGTRWQGCLLLWAFVVVMRSHGAAGSGGRCGNVTVGTVHLVSTTEVKLPLSLFPPAACWPTSNIYTPRHHSPNNTRHGAADL